MYRSFIASLDSDLRALVTSLTSVTDLNKIMMWQENHCDYRESPPVVARYQELFVKSLFEQRDFESLTEWYYFSNGVNRQLIIARYEELLIRITDVCTLEELFQDCPAPCEQLIIDRYKEILALIGNTTELENIYDNYMGSFFYFLLDRYQEILASKSDLVDLEKLFEECPEPFEQVITLRYQEVLSIWLPRQKQLNNIKERYIKCPDGLQHLFFIKECWG